MNVGCPNTDDIIPDHLRQVCNDNSKGLTDEQQTSFKSFLMKWQESFAKPGEVGKMDKGAHRTKLDDTLERSI